jgi:hypothetical protein
MSSARGARIFHPEGSVHVGEAQLYDAFPGSLSGMLQAEYRLSRAFGLPTWIGDFYGLAVRLYPGDASFADLLFASSFEGALGKWMPRPHHRSGRAVILSSLLPYATTAGQLVWLGASVTPPRGLTWDTMIATDAAPAAIRLCAADLLHRPTTCGHLHRSVSEPQDRGTALRFNPWHAPPGLRPAGWINALRDPAYRGSQRGRAAKEPRGSSRLADPSTEEPPC